MESRRAPVCFWFLFWQKRLCEQTARVPGRGPSRPGPPSPTPCAINLLLCLHLCVWRTLSPQALKPLNSLVLHHLCPISLCHNLYRCSFAFHFLQWRKKETLPMKNIIVVNINTSHKWSWSRPSLTQQPLPLSGTGRMGYCPKHELCLSPEAWTRQNWPQALR